jgi:hypothetical protein
MKTIFNKNNGGYALVTALIFFLTGTTAIIASIANAVFREVRTVRNESLSKQSYFTSESAAEDIALRMKNGITYGPVETLNLASTSAEVTVTSASDGSQIITSKADASNTKRNTTINLDTGSFISFSYAAQSGLGGIDLEGGVEVSGDIYTTGSIRGCGSCSVMGTAVAAGKSSSILDQNNFSPSTPPNSITFGNNNSSQDLTQSFTVSSSTSLIGISLYVRKNNNPSNATIKITTDNGGKPSGTVLASGTLSSSLVSTSYTLLDITLTANPVLSAGTTYWIVIDANTDSSDYYIAAANNSYATGLAKVGRYNNNSWNDTSPSGLDAYFKIYIGKNEEGVTGESEFNQLIVGSAYAYQIKNVTTSGILYCQVGSGNNKPCDTSRSDPVIQSNPISDTIITDWKNEAATDIYPGDYSIGWAGATLGPKKIEGNLTINSGGTLRVSGVLWVTGNILIDGGSTIMPADSTKSYVIITDGTLMLTGGSEILGSTGSHILLVSTGTADPVFTLNGGANDTVLYVPNGGVLATGGALVKAMAANHITLSGGADLVYDPDVARLAFPPTVSSGGGGFKIKSWKETQ